MQLKPSLLALVKQNVHHLLRLMRSHNQPHILIQSDDELFSALSPQTPILQSAISAFQDGDITQAQLLLTEHLRTRAQPQFFLAPHEVKPALDRLIAAFPEWRRYTLEAASEFANTSPHDPPEHISSQWSGDIHLLQFAPLLARISLIEPRFRTILSAQLQNWIVTVEAIPDPPAYSSNLPAVFRGIGLTWAIIFLLGATSAATDGALETTVLKIILTDGRFVAARIGTSFPNNHLLADGFFLWYLGTLFPEFTEAAGWRSQGEVIWLEQLERQIYTDGTSFEHSFHYHELACEMATCYLLLCAKNQVSVPTWVEVRIKKMLAFQSDIAGPEAAPITFGDSGDHSLLSGLDSGGKWACAAQRQIYRALFEPNLPSSPEHFPSEERAFWLLGGCLPEPIANAAAATTSAYTLGGFFVFPDRNPITRLVFRAGPAPNTLVNPGHMHADLLSIYVHLQGVPVIVDTGTYTYRRKAYSDPPNMPDWRAYCLSPRAHNGLALDSLDPLARGEGDFPGGPIQSRVDTSVSHIGQNFAWVEGRIASTTAYSNFRRGVLHIQNTYWIVYEVIPDLPCATPPSFGLQFSCEAQIHLTSPHVILVDLEQAELLIATSSHYGAPAILRGNISPPDGWVAPQHGVKKPAPMLRFAAESNSPPLAMLLAAHDRLGKNAAIEIEPVGEGALGLIIRYEGFIDYILLNSHQEHITWRGMQFKGAALWLHTLQNHAIELRWLDATQFVWAAYDVSIQTPIQVQTLQVTRQGEKFYIEGTQAETVKVVFGKP